VLEDLGNIGDFLGGIGVVVTLAYLAVQIRKNTQSVRSAALHSVSTSISEFMDKVAQDPVLTKLWFDGLGGTAQLSEADRQRFNLLLMSLVRRWENAFHQSRAGMLESASWSGMQEGIAFVVSSPGAQAWWKVARTLFSPEFVAFAERAFDERRPPASPPSNMGMKTDAE
jgi:hypothetical protein